MDKDCAITGRTKLGGTEYIFTANKVYRKRPKPKPRTGSWLRCRMGQKLIYCRWCRKHRRVHWPIPGTAWAEMRCPYKADERIDGPREIHYQFMIVRG